MDSSKMKRILKRDKPQARYGPHNCLSTGVALLNLALSGRADGGIPQSNYAYFVGDSSSGKTFFSMNLLAEACINPNFKEHRLVFDNAENGALMDVRKFWGPLADRIEPPSGTVGDPTYSHTVEEFYFHLDDLYRKKEPFVYVLDSMDALESVDDEEKFLKNKEAYRKGSEAKGTYGMTKAKLNSQNIKRYATRLAETGSILVVISQTRDKVNSPFPMRTWGGGKALNFYAHVQILTSRKGDLKRKDSQSGRDRVIGSTIQIEVCKNRITGWDGKIEVPFFRKYGLDDVGACIDYLVAEGHWKKTRGGVEAEEFDYSGRKQGLVERIQKESGEPELYQIMQSVWDRIEEESSPYRKNKYTD